MIVFGIHCAMTRTGGVQRHSSPKARSKGMPSLTWHFDYGTEPLLIAIMEFLTPRELFICCEVSRKWFDAATEDELWQLPNKTMAMTPLRFAPMTHPMERMRPPTGEHSALAVAGNVLLDFATAGFRGLQD